jgi:hypothetical protein
MMFGFDDDVSAPRSPAGTAIGSVARRMAMLHPMG